MMLEREKFAVLHLRKVEEWTPGGRKAVAAWLRAQASELLSETVTYGSNYVAEYTARVKNGARSDHR